VFSGTFSVEKQSDFGGIVAATPELQEVSVAGRPSGELVRVMNRTLAEHIGTLEQKLNLISAQIMQENDTHKRNHLESELRAVESALTHYRSAFAIESQLASRPGS
jgi:hypothetical protein